MNQIFFKVRAYTYPSQTCLECKSKELYYLGLCHLNRLRVFFLSKNWTFKFRTYILTMNHERVVLFHIMLHNIVFI